MNRIIAPDTPDTIDPTVAEALNGVPDFFDLPAEYRQAVEAATVKAERMFWLRSNVIEKTPLVEAILRRAFYAEQRCAESEFRLAEISLITSGLREEIERLQDEITTISGHVDG